VQLNSQQIQPFPKLGARLEVPSTHGVYVIREPRGRIAHVGRTVRGRAGLLQRLRNHLRGQSSFAIVQFRGKGEMLRRGYTFQFLEVPDGRARALLEFAATAWHCPHHLGIGARRGGNRK
jgi:hypothetical protein